MGYAAALADAISASRFARYDYAILYNFSDHVWSSMALKRFPCCAPVVCHVGTIPADCMANQVKLMLSSPHTGRVKFVFPSRVVRDRIVELGARPESLGPVIWNGVDVEKYASARKMLYSDDAAVLRVSFVGRMAPGAKDFEMLIRAWGLTDTAKTGRGRLCLAGDGPSRKEYEKLAAEVAPRGSVDFLGTLDANGIVAFLATSDIFVMAALPVEGMSIALVEAIATGLPIIATSVRANSEVLAGGDYGCLVCDAREMATAIDDLARSKDARREARARAEKLREDFPIQRCVQGYLGFLMSLAREGHGSLGESHVDNT